MTKERKENLMCYLKIFLGTILTFPLTHAFLALEFGSMKGGVIAACIYITLNILAIPLFNYLQYGIFSFRIKKHYYGKTW